VRCVKRRALARAATVLGFLVLLGCDSRRNSTGPGAAVDLSNLKSSIELVRSDPAKVRQADYSILFVGNSHTTLHDIPGLVARMIEFANPGKTAYTHILPVMFLEQTAGDARVTEEVDNREWKYVVLQAQKISQSGKYHYSRQEGIDLAKRAKARGAEVIFFSEWGLRGVPNDGQVQEKIYQEMADQSGARVAAVGRVWDHALTHQPDLPLYSVDGNHQSAQGAFATACALFASVTGQDPALLSKFPYDAASETQRQFLAQTASAVFKK
jgi:hypothetical protein